jgi:hypothetical protein
MEAFSVSETISFEDAIALSQKLFAESLSAAELESIISALVQTENGARGFFVTYLTNDAPQDLPLASVVQGLRASPSIVGELLVKNLAMSTAMILTHDRKGKTDLVNGSKRVQQRTLQVMQELQSPAVQAKLQQLRDTLESGNGEYQNFLDRWGYDAEQRQAIQAVI